MVRIRIEVCCYILALVAVGENWPTEPIYVRNAFDAEPGWGVNSANYSYASSFAHLRPEGRREADRSS